MNVKSRFKKDDLLKWDIKSTFDANARLYKAKYQDSQSSADEES